MLELEGGRLGVVVQLVGPPFQAPLPSPLPVGVVGPPTPSFSADGGGAAAGLLVAGAGAQVGLCHSL